MDYFIEKRCNFENFLDGFSISLIESFGVEFDSSFGGEKRDYRSHEFNPVFFLIDVIWDVSLRIVPLTQPVEDIGD